MIPSVSEPANRIQRKIKEMISRLTKPGVSCQSGVIYKILEDFFPFMSDEDMYFVDKTLKMQGGEAVHGGNLLVNGIRMCTVDAKWYDQHQDLGDVSYTKSRAMRLQQQQ